MANPEGAAPLDGEQAKEAGQSPTMERVNQALMRKLALAELTAAEQDLVFDKMIQAYSEPSEEVRAAYAEIGERTHQALLTIHGRRNAAPNSE